MAAPTAPPFTETLPHARSRFMGRDRERAQVDGHMAPFTDRYTEGVSPRQRQLNTGSSVAPMGRAIDDSELASSGTVPPLIGRAREQAVLREELSTAVGGCGRLVLLG